MGTVESVGTGVKTVHPGDRVLVSCITACGTCRFCREARYGQCLGGGGWILGNTIDGTQAEFVRVPFADTSTYPCPVGVADEQLLMLSDILPTGYEVGVLNGAGAPRRRRRHRRRRAHRPRRRSSEPSSTAPPTSWPSTRSMPASKRPRPSAPTSWSTTAARTPCGRSTQLTNGLGADVAIEAVGIPATFELATRLIRPGGRVANIGVHGEAATLHLEDLWSRNVTITTGLVDTYSTPTLLELAAHPTGRRQPTP